jgi:APA family basic amino acid/polyamine antiporter
LANIPATLELPATLDTSMMAPQSERRTLGVGACTALVLGNIVGVGIFLTPAEVARTSSGALGYFGFWILGALISIAGAMVTAELGTLFPRAGGDYVFLDKAYGRSVAAAWGTLSLLATFAGSVAALAVGAVETLQAASFGAIFSYGLFSLAGMAFDVGDLTAVGLVAIATWANVRSVSLVGRIQLLFTWIPIAIYCLVGIGCLVWAADVTIPSVAATGAPSDPNLVEGSIATAFSSVFFTYAGWNVLTYVGGDVKHPERTLPRGIVGGLAVTLVVYLLLNVAFFTIIPIDVLASERNTGVVLARAYMGDAGADAFALFMLLLIIAGLNVTVMAGSRVALAMGRHGYLWGRLSELHPKTGTPTAALWLQGLWCSLLVLTGSFSLLVTWTGAVMILLSLFTVGAVFVFRRRGMKAPYQAPGYPWLPLFYIVTGAGILGLGVVSQAGYLLAGIGAFVGLALLHGLRMGRRVEATRH